MAEVEALKAEVARLEAEKQTILEKYVPSLRTRVSIVKLMADLDGYMGKHVGIGGWIRSVRSGGGVFVFVKLYDGTCGSELQLIVPSELEGYDQIKTGSVGTSIFVVGEICPSQGREQRAEMRVEKLRVLGVCDNTKYPLAGKRHPLEYLRTIQHMRPRTAVLGAVSRVRNALAFGTHTYFQEEGYQYVNTPLITASDCEGGGEMFQVTTMLEDGKLKHKLPDGKPDYSHDFFKRPAFLTVSGQLNGEIMATALSSIYTFGPTFRAEDSHTSRHLAEFWMIEPEIAFADLQENMEIAEAYLKFVIKVALERCPKDMEILEAFEIRNAGDRKKEEKRAVKEAAKQAKARAAEEAKKAKAEGREIPKQAKKPKNKKGKPEPADWRAMPLRERLHSIVNAQFARVTYTQAIEILLEAVENGKRFVEMNIHWGMDLGSEHERFLCEVHFQRPTIVTNYPKEMKAFYMRVDEDQKTVAAMDILVPGVGELIGGSQREERPDVLAARIREMGLNPEDYGWYMDLRTFGSVPHSGFGAGFERLVCYTTGMDNIRDAIPFPRFPGHADY